MAWLAAVALTLLTVVGAGSLWFTGLQGADDPLRPEQGPSAGDSTPGAQIPVENSHIDELRTDFGPTQAITVEPQAAWKGLDRSFEGTCTISGVVEVVGDRPFPNRWTLVIVPTQHGFEGDRAVRRVIAMEGAQRTFEEHDLPMGGYVVSVEAEGLTSRPQEVLLFKFKGQEHLRGKDHAHFILTLERTGFIDGSVRDAGGSVVGGLLVTLENLENLETREPSQTTTSPAGVWRIENMREGRYRITFGNPARPLVPAEEFTFTGSQQPGPATIVPVTGSIRFLVVGGMGQVLPDARVRGIGTGGGTVDVITGPNGEALARFLLPGKYNLRVADPSGHSGKLSFDIEGNEREQLVEISCRLAR